MKPTNWFRLKKLPLIWWWTRRPMLWYLCLKETIKKS